MYDVIIRGGDVIDGTGAARRRADVGINGDRISSIADLGEAEATQVIDATGHVVAPGFVDVHTHVDAQVFWDTTVSRRRCTASPRSSAATAGSACSRSAPIRPTATT